MIYFPYNPMALGAVTSPVAGVMAALIMLGLLLMSAGGVALSADRDWQTTDVREGTQKIDSPIQEGFGAVRRRHFSRRCEAAWMAIRA